MSCTDRCRRPSAGSRQSHCSVCHRTFSGLRNFDTHRKGGKCVHPASLGMSDREQIWGHWGSNSRWWV